MGNWPEGISDGLCSPCLDCGEVPRFDYHVEDSFWRTHIPKNKRVSVICLPCLDRRCKGIGLADALEEIQWTGIGHTVVFKPVVILNYGRSKAGTSG